MGFQWLTLDGCAVCMGLEGHWDAEPGRPHPNCDCEIFEDVEALEPGWCWGEIEGGPEVLTQPLRIITYFSASKVCPDGQEVTEYFEIEETVDEYIERIDDPAVWDAAYDAMLDRIYDLCANELEWHCSEFVVPDP